ncbi:uncharacterized protein [Haliotis asinina]|uniref:uncharacterized protein n=1 Tax=Haliotis asinina TaxID=109174 RepID=UPI003531902A
MDRTESGRSNTVNIDNVTLNDLHDNPRIQNQASTLMGQFVNPLMDSSESQGVQGSNASHREGPCTSPLNTVPKSDKVRRRVVVDLSSDGGSGVNKWIPKDSYLGQNGKLQYPSVDDLVEIVKVKGKGCLLFKRDLKRAYRQIPVDPGDINLFGYKWQHHLFVDRVLAMGLRSAAYICQRVINAVAYIAKSENVDVVNYLDDFGGCDKPQVADTAFRKLGDVIQKCGLEEAWDKACAPTTNMIFLGSQFNTGDHTLTIDAERLREIHDLTASWLEQTHTTLREAQSLLGKLNFVASCVRPGRIFLGRLIGWIKTLPESGSHDIIRSAKLDIQWWNIFLSLYNGTSMMALEEWSHPDAVLATDACLHGCGTWFDGQYFHRAFPKCVQERQYSISVLELLTITKKAEKALQEVFMNSSGESS